MNLWQILKIAQNALLTAFKVSYNKSGQSICPVTCLCPAVSNSLQPYRLQLARLLCPWDCPGKNTGVGCHVHLQGIFLIYGSNPQLLCLMLCGQILYCQSGGTLISSTYMLSHSSCVALFVTLWTVAHQAPLSIGFSRQEYWSGLPCHSPGDLPSPGIEPVSLMSPALASWFFTTGITWEGEP